MRILRETTPTFTNLGGARVATMVSIMQPPDEVAEGWADGLPTSHLNEVTPLMYKELRRIAGMQLRREGSGHTLQPTALVHEAWLRLAGNSQLVLDNRLQFLALASEVMRHILVDHARRRAAGKRDGGTRVTLTDGLNIPAAATAEALSDALEALRKRDPRKARLIALRFFGGLTGGEMAEVTGLSTSTVARELRLAEAWLHREITNAGSRDADVLGASA